ncbi:corticoliberin-like [Pristis pectinata]|uniref:corticoliberin-like n=1 Tax=Pristis pectinata TaxID=685728 RepID=UPI00223D1093|nr:corticoliberin-like [Pristis pectinata]
MKTPLLLCTALLLVGFVPGDDCRALQNSVSTEYGPGQQSELQHLVSPAGIRFGESYLKPQAKAHNNPSLGRNLLEMFPFDGASKMPLARFQRNLPGKVGDLDHVYGRYQDLVDEMSERGKRRDTPLLSLNVPLHVLNKLLAIARAEQMAKQAEENKKIMDEVGK